MKLRVQDRLWRLLSEGIPGGTYNHPWLSRLLFCWPCEPIRDHCGLPEAEVERWKKIAQANARTALDREAERDSLRALCDKLAEAITTVLEDEETGAGGWGPDVTMAGVLRQALASYREHKGEPPPGKGG